MPNKYEESGEIDEEYAEIGYVSSSAMPNYDPVYVPGQGNVGTENGSPNPACNGHTYQNVGKSKVDPPLAKSKQSQSVFGHLKSKTEKVWSFFKKQPDGKMNGGATPVKKGDGDMSGGSYDHLRPSSGVFIEYKPPEDNPGHVYSHAKAIPEVTVTDESEAPNYTNTNINSDKGKIQASTSKDKDAKAVHVGDAYIEFTFDDVDENKLVKTKTTENEHARPDPPKRPPPSPRNSPKITSPVKTPGNSNKNSTNILSPESSPPNDPPCYDYAEGSPRASPKRRLSNASDNSSEHSYKILEPQPMYDYADVSDQDVPQFEDSYGSIYEDVDTNAPREDNLRKHKSATEEKIDQGEYLEPIENRGRTASYPDNVVHKNTGYVNSPRTDAKSNKTENRTKVPEYENNPRKSEESKDKNIIKSDNVKAKNCEKAAEVKGVLRMKEMFEKKDSSDSESSRQNSPRNNDVTGNDNQKQHLKKKTNKTESDA